MTTDPYVTCPCGSGKKLKFCCADIAVEMDKAIHLQQGHQHKAALKVIEKINAKFPNRVWVLLNKAILLLSLGRHDESREATSALLEIDPRHTQGLVFDAVIAFEQKGFEAAKRPFHKATQAAVKSRMFFPVLLELITLISQELHADGKHIAARQHLALAMRLSTEETQQDIFNKLLEFDSDQSVPHPFRGVHRLPKLQLDGEEETKKIRKAVQLQSIGCWEEAAKVLDGLKANHSENASLLHTLGMMHAWDGNEAAAATALHQAAQLYHDSKNKQHDRDLAIELETLAQVLTLNAPENKLAFHSYSFSVDQASKMISIMAESDHFYDLEGTQGNQQLFYFYDQPVIVKEITDVFPEHLGIVSYQDAPQQGSSQSSDDSSPKLSILIQSELQDAALKRLKELLGEFLSDQTENSRSPAYQHPPKELQGLFWNRPSCQEVSSEKEMAFFKDRWENYANKEWYNTPLLALEGKTPLETKGNSEKELELIASVKVLDIFADFSDRSADLPAMLKKLDCQPASPLDVTDDTELNGLSYAQLRRMDPTTLTDDQLHHVMSRGLLMRHTQFLQSVLTEALSRPALRPKIDLDRVYLTLSELAEKTFHLEEALKWVLEGKKLASESEDPFREKLNWILVELRILSKNPESDNFRSALIDVHAEYAKKLPQVESFLDGLIEMAGIETPWKEETGSAILSSSDSQSGESGKLWLPGQS